MGATQQKFAVQFFMFGKVIVVKIDRAEVSLDQTGLTFTAGAATASVVTGCGGTVLHFLAIDSDGNLSGYPRAPFSGHILYGSCDLISVGGVPVRVSSILRLLHATYPGW